MRKGDIVLLKRSPALENGSFGLVTSSSANICVVLVDTGFLGFYYKWELKRICRL